MAHEINTMAYTGKRPWHGLGVKLPENQPIEEWKIAAGFNFRIESSSVQYTDVSGMTKTFPDRIALYRSDNGDPLSIRSNHYRVVQPSEVLDFFRDLTNDVGFTMESAAVLKQGQKYFALARTHRQGYVGQSEHKQYVLLATACDGTMATTAMLTDVRVVCANTLAMAVDGLEKKIKIRHSVVFDADNAKERLGLLDFDTVMNAHLDNMKKLLRYSIPTDVANDFFAEILTSKQVDRDRTRAIRGLDLLKAGYTDEVGSAYGVLQAITHFVDHVRSDNADKRQTSAIFGQGAALKRKAYSQLLKLAA